MADDIHKQIADAVKTGIESLSLPRSGDIAVVVRRHAWDRDKVFPGITVAWSNQIVEGRGTNERDDYGYPAVVTCIRGYTGAGVGDDLADRTTWSQDIQRNFHNKRLSISGDTGVNEITTVCHRPTFRLPARFQDRYWGFRLVVIGWYREHRTV